MRRWINTEGRIWRWCGGTKSNGWERWKHEHAKRPKSLWKERPATLSISCLCATKASWEFHSKA